MSAVQVVWFKRDLRLADHEPLRQACQSELPTVLLYCFEPELLADPHYSLRHWRFVRQSLQQMQQQLAPFGAQLLVRNDSALRTLALLHQRLGIARLLSHQETGLAVTFQRDREVARWCQQQGIPWQEWPSDGVVRGLRHRRHWRQHWQQVQHAPQAHPALWRLRPAPVESLQQPLPQLGNDSQFQQGGELQARQWLREFQHYRCQAYPATLSTPQSSRSHSSRLSPYLAWGNLSVRQLVQASRAFAHPGRRAFVDRLQWRSHFIQKFESECAMEHRPVNRGYLGWQFRDDTKADALLRAWQKGQTGLPLVDAAMRCLQHTGFINFRLRAMLVSVLCHHLNLPWQAGARHLARLFLDFEPGIHYPQVQMQAGLVGTHALRVYNPTRQALLHDAKGEFVRRWLPELRHLPTELMLQPWTLTPMEQSWYRFTPGQSYPAPLFDPQQSGRNASERLWQWRQRPAVQHEAQRILSRHVNPGSGVRR
ncbi:cryptochrome/deoxyribodipyrimidine photo-lyase family protein [Ferrimonas marina]|uniref:Deoxyribodipyrimidine photo-lyase n=1 Tax=Ferrimonas marina TaxID=299255 RepID=A0A1M5MY47_9GAMM|nr:FAD-binding domain-containing protein [Ferrimonas marina]SHG82228.1 deoxyribodipyrimidine photo-lyase [Ferrimonas marina]